jgi:ABC-type hemin transport system substrate-binding protein
MPDHAWSRQELLDQIAAAIVQTRTITATAARERILIELEDVAAHLRTGEQLTAEYRETLFFDVVALRELDDAADTHLPYLNLLSEIAAAIEELDPPP